MQGVKGDDVNSDICTYFAAFNQRSSILLPILTVVVNVEEL